MPGLKMPVNETDVFSPLPVRARVAIVLCVLQRLRPLFDRQTHVTQQVKDAIDIACR